MSDVFFPRIFRVLLLLSILTVVLWMVSFQINEEEDLLAEATTSRAANAIRAMDDEDEVMMIRPPPEPPPWSICETRDPAAAMGHWIHRFIFFNFILFKFSFLISNYVLIVFLLKFMVLGLL
ncbi:unnamed protein product [Cuscuta epithymum]|uniref:Uncharacterized protein n=1 Tax=Cuscuta epithymum TaxID=186058 RepID=A0AAV0ET28_9ASTE|nr:unnamed protein product [Cuscuta epithymum]